MAELNESGIKSHIKQGEFYNAYLFFGEESYLKEFYLSQLKSKIVPPAFEAFNYRFFDGKQSSLDDIIKDAQMLPVMSEYNFVLIRDYPVEKSKSDMKQLKEFLSDVPESTVLVLCYDSAAPDVKSASFKSLRNMFDKAGTVVQLDRKSESELIKLLVSGAAKRGAVLSSANAGYLISLAGSDMTVLLNELDKLSAFAGGGEITRDIIDDMAVKCLQARVYDLSKAVVSGNADAAYSVLDTLFSMREDPILLTAVISGVYVDMYRVKCAKSAGMGYDDVAAHFNYRGREFALRNASRDCASLSEKQLRASLDVIADTDLKLKSTAVDKRVLIEEMIVKLMMIAGGRAYA